MKKIVVFALVMMMVFASAFVGCAPQQAPAAQPAEAPQAPAPAPQEQPVSSDTEIPADETGWPEFKEKIYLGISVRTLSNPYLVKVKEGAEQLAQDLIAAGYDVEVSTLLCEGSDEKQVSDIKAFIARGGKNAVLYVDPNNSPTTAVIADICEEANVYWASVWNIADGIYPMDYKYWVSHSSADDVLAGYEVAVDIFERFEVPGKGKILALEGMLGNSASQGRTNGLDKALAEFPDVERLDMQPTDWDTTKSLNITETWLSKYGEFDGIWTAGDPMAIGAITALKKAGLAGGKVKVAGLAGTQEAFDAIAAGDLTNTWDFNGFMQGYYISAMVIAARIGQIDVQSLPIASRMFLTPGKLITPENLEEATAELPVCDFKDFESFNLGPMENDWKK